MRLRILNTEFFFSIFHIEVITQFLGRSNECQNIGNVYALAWCFHIYKCIHNRHCLFCSLGRHLHGLCCSTEPPTLLFVRCSGSVVAVRYEPDGPVFSLLENAQTGCRPHKASYLMGTSAKVKNVWSSTSTPSLCLHDLDKENVTFTKINVPNLARSVC